MLNWPQKRRFWMQETSVGGRLSDAPTSMRESAWSYGFALSLWHMRCTFSCSALTACTRPWASRVAAMNESIMLQQQGQRTHQQDTVLLLIIQTLHFFPPDVFCELLISLRRSRGTEEVFTYLLVFLSSEMEAPVQAAAEPHPLHHHLTLHLWNCFLSYHHPAPQW